MRDNGWLYAYRMYSKECPQVSLPGYCCLAGVQPPYSIEYTVAYPPTPRTSGNSWRPMHLPRGCNYWGQMGL
jgi:hypothetical protein